MCVYVCVCVGWGGGGGGCSAGLFQKDSIIKRVNRPDTVAVHVGF